MSGKSKKAKVAFFVSKRNFNRVQFKTHSLERVLKISGYCLSYGEGIPCVANPIDGSMVPLSEVELHITKKEKPIMAAPPKKAPAPTPVPIPESQAS